VAGAKAIQPFAVARGSRHKQLTQRLFNDITSADSQETYKEAGFWWVWIAVPIGDLMSRYSFRGKALVDAVLDIPIVLPPLIIGLSLLILFRTPAGRFVERFIPMTYAVPGIILAQGTVACAFAVRTMRTEVMPTSVFLELSVGNIEAAVAVPLLTVIAAMIVLLLVRALGRPPL
jgi:ABC-type sulfate transport system permease component